MGHDQNDRSLERRRVPIPLERSTHDLHLRHALDFAPTCFPLLLDPLVLAPFNSSIHFPPSHLLSKTPPFPPLYYPLSHSHYPPPLPPRLGSYSTHRPILSTFSPEILRQPPLDPPNDHSRRRWVVSNVLAPEPLVPNSLGRDFETFLTFLNPTLDHSIHWDRTFYLSTLFLNLRTRTLIREFTLDDPIGNDQETFTTSIEGIVR